MKNFLAIFLFFFSLSGVYPDFLGREGWGEVFSQPTSYKPGPNKMVINLDTSTLKFELPLKDVKTKAKNELSYYWYKSNKIMQTKGGYETKLLHGAYTEFYLSNNLKEQGAFKKGLKNGEWKSWYENGQHRQIVHYCNGLNYGKYQSYNEKGELTLEANYKKGKLHGETVTYENGKVLAKHKYKKGNEVLPKPEKIKEDKKNKRNWKFWNKDTSPKEEKPSEKEKRKKPNSKDTKTSNG